MPTQKIVTVHNSVGYELRDRILTAVEAALEETGATDLRLDPWSDETTVLAVLPTGDTAAKAAG